MSLAIPMRALPTILWTRMRARSSAAPLHWRLVFICSSLAALLVLAVLAGLQHVVVAHFEAEAVAQTDDLARSMSNLFSRALDRRAAELRLLARSIPPQNLDDPVAVRQELARLADAPRAYRWIAAVDAAGSVRGALGALPQSMQPPGAVALRVGPVATQDAMTRPPATGVANAGPSSPVEMVAPLRHGGALVGELDWDWFRELRDELLPRSSNPTVLSVAVFTHDGQPLLSDNLHLNRRARAAYAARRTDEVVGLFRYGDGAARVLAAQHTMRPRIAEAAAGWSVVVTRNLDATLGPVRRLDLFIMALGVGMTLIFSAVVYWFARRAVTPYANLLDAVTDRFRSDQGARANGLTKYLDMVAAELAQQHQARVPRATPQALMGVQQPLELIDMLGLIAEDGSRLQQLLDALPIGVTVFDGELRVMYWNRRCEAIFGWSAQEVVGRIPFETYAKERGDAEAAEIVDRVHERIDTYSVTRSYRRRDGSLRQCTLIISPERNAQGKLVRVLQLVQDDTDRLAAEQGRAVYAREVSALARQLLDHEAQITSRLAQTLHDRLGQTLSALRLAYDAAGARGRSAAMTEASPIGFLIDQAVSEVREALVELRPPLLDDQGLAAALENETRSLRCNPRQVQISLTLEESISSRRFAPEVEYAAFMVAREAIGNALRHANAGHIEVQVRCGQHSLSFEVQDDGTGFDQQVVAMRVGHLGLVGMRERALAIGAVLVIRSAPGSGSRVRFDWVDA